VSACAHGSGIVPGIVAAFVPWDLDHRQPHSASHRHLFDEHIQKSALVRVAILAD
jgi:hypothetical protein